MKRKQGKEQKQIKAVQQRVARKDAAKQGVFAQARPLQELPEHPTILPLRRETVLQMQEKQGNSSVQELIDQMAKTKKNLPVPLSRDVQNSIRKKSVSGRERTKVRRYRRKLQKLDKAKSYLKTADDLYNKNWASIRKGAFGSTELMVKLLTMGITQVQEWAGAEQLNLIEEFQTDKTKPLLDATVSSAIGLAPPPFGPILGFVASAGIGYYRNHQTDKQVNESVAVSQFATDAGIKGTEFLMTLVNYHGSLLHQLGQLDGLGVGMFTSTGVGDLRNFINLHEARVKQFKYVSSDTISLELKEAKNFKERYVDLEIAFYKARRNLLIAASRVPSQTEEALEKVKLMYVRSVSNGTILISGNANVEQGGLKLKAKIDKLGEYSSSRIGRDTLDYLNSLSPKDLSKQGKGTGVFLPLKMQWETGFFSRGTVTAKPIFYWKNGQFKYEPDRDSDNAMKVIKPGTTSSQTVVNDLANTLESLQIGDFENGIYISLY